jgi:hypothetical protein
MIFFVAAATGAIFYSQGYRFDLKNLKMLKTGGISIKASPINARVFLNQKLAGTTMPMADYVFVQGLLPKTYEVKVEKDGYAPWSKTLEVEETKVTEAKSVVLFPQSIQFNGKKFGLENIQPLSSEKIVLLHQPSDEAEKVSIYDLNREEEIGIASINALLASNDLTDVEVLDPQNLLFILKNNKSGKTGYYYVNLQSQSLAAQKLDFIGEGSDNFAFASSFGDKIIFWRENEAIFKRLLSSDGISQKFSAEKTAAFSLSEGYFYMLSKEGILSKTDQNKNFPSQRLADQPLEIKNAGDLKISVFAGQVFLKDGTDLYLLDEKERSLKKIFEGVNDLKISPFGDKLLCHLQNELWVYTLKDIDAPYQEKAGTKIFIFRFSQPIQRSDWIDDNYFVFSTDNKIKISEMDIRSNINTYEIAGFESSDIWFSQKNKSLYILSKETLLVSDKLLSR